MEEAVKKLTACTSSGTNWPYALVQLYEGPHHATLPKDKYPGHPTSGKGRGNPLWVDHPTRSPPTLATGPQVIYPIGLHGQDEPIRTTLPELLGSGISLTMSEHIYLEIDIPSLPMKEPDQKIPPLDKVSTILITSHINLPQNQKAV